MKNQKRMGTLLRLTAIVAVALLCVGAISASFACPNVASAQTLTVAQSPASVSTMETSGRIMNLKFSSAIDWNSGYTVNYDSNLSQKATFFHGNDASITYNDDGSVKVKHESAAVNYKTMTITYFSFDSALQPLIDAGALQVQVKASTSGDSQISEMLIKGYFNTDDILALAEISSTDDDTDANSAFQRIRDDSTYQFASGKGLNASSGTYATITVPTGSKYFAVNLQTKKSTLSNKTATFSNISVTFTVDKSKLGEPVSYNGQDVAGNTFGNLSAISLTAKGANTPYGFVTSDTKETVSANMYVPTNGSAVLADTVFGGKTADGVTVKGAVMCLTGMGSVVSGGTLTEKITFAFDGGAEKTLAEAISEGYLSSYSTNTWGDTATTVNFNWTFVKNTAAVVRFYNLKGDALVWNLTLTGIDTDTPSTPVFVGDTSKWYVTDDAIDLFDVSSSVENDVIYLYQYAYSAVGFDDIDESTLTLKRSSKTTTEVKGADVKDGKLSFAFPKGSGYYKVKAVAIDGAGNCSAETAVYNLKIDKDEPVANIRATTADGKVYSDGEWVNQNVSITVHKLKSTTSGTVFMYSTDGGATWNDANTVTEGDVLTIAVEDGGQTSCVYTFKAVKGTGQEFVVGDVAYNVNIDKKAPLLPTITEFDPYLVSAGYNWYTDAWTMSVRFDFDDDRIGSGDGIMMYYTITERDGTYVGGDEYALQAVDNRLTFDFAGSALGGKRTITVYTVDQAGNRSENDLVIDFLADANVYVIGADASVNSLTGATGGKITLNNADRKYTRNDTVTGKVVAASGYKFFQSDFSAVYSNGTVTLDGNDGFSVDLYKNVIDADPSDISFEASFRKIVSPTVQTAELVYNGELRLPALVDANGTEISDMYAYATGDFEALKKRNVGDYSFTLTYKDNADVWFNDVEISYSVVAATLTVVPNLGQSKVYGEAEPSVLKFTASGFMGTDSLDAASVLKRADGQNVGKYAYDVSAIGVNDGNGGKNYVVSVADDADLFEITKRPITLKPLLTSSTYNGVTVYSDAVLSDGTLAAGDELDSLDVMFLVGTDAGSYTALPVTRTGVSTDVAGSAANANYAISFDVSEKIVINPQTVNFAFQTVHAVYGSTAQHVVATSSSIISESDYTVSNVVREDGNAAGEYAYVSADIVIENANFVLGTVDLESGKYIIDKKDASVKFGGSATYGDDFTATFVFDGLVEGDTVPAELSSYHVGQVLVVGTLPVTVPSVFATSLETVLPNYNFDYSELTSITVLPRSITATVGRTVLVEELETNPVTSDPTSIGLIFKNVVEGGADMSGITLSYTDESGNAVTPSAEGFFTVLFNNLPSEYVLTGETVLVVGKGKVVVVSVNSATKAYDGVAVNVADLLAFTVDGAEFVPADGELTVNLGTASEIKNVGTYSVSVNVKRAATETEPACFGFAKFDFTVSAAHVSVNVLDLSRTYGDTVPTALNYTLTGVAAGHNGSVELSGFDSVDAGSYTLTVAKFTVLDGDGTEVTANYVLDDVDVVYTVNKAPLTIRFIGGTATYGVLRPSVSYEAEGFVAGDDESVLTVGTATLKTPYAVPVPGVYTEIEAKGFAAANYDIVFDTDGFRYVIGKKEVAVTEDSVYASDKTYDGTANAAGTVDISAFVVGTDDVYVTADASFDSADSGVRTVTFTNIKLQGEDSAYYSLSLDGDSLTVGGVVISKYVWAVNDTTFNVSVAGKVYDGTNLIPTEAITGADTCIPEIFRNSGVKISIHGTYNDKNAGTDVTATLTVSVALTNWANNVEFVESGSVKRISSDKDKVSFVVETSGLEIAKRELVIGSIKVGDIVFDGKADLNYLKFNTYFVEGKDIVAGDVVYLDASGTLDDVNVGLRTATFTVSGLRTVGSYGNYVLDAQANDSFIGNELTCDVNVKPRELALEITLEQGRSYIGQDANTIGIDSSALVWGADGSIGFNPDVYFVWNRNVQALFADGTGNVSVDSRGNVVAKRVVVSGIELVQSDKITSDPDLAAKPIYNVSNYVISGVTDGKYYTEATVLPKQIEIDADGIVLNDKYYDKTTDGSISFIANAVRGVVESDKGLVAPKSTVVWTTSDAGDSTAYVNIVGLEGEKASNYVLSETIGMLMSGTIKPAQITVKEVVFDDKNYDGTTAATFRKATIEGVYGGDIVALEVYDYAFVSADVAYVSDGVYGNVKITAKARLTDSSNRNYSLYSDTNAVDSIELEDSAVILPYVLGFGKDNIKITPIVYELAFLDRDPSAPMDIDGNNYSVKYETLPGGETIEIKFSSARYMAVVVGNNVSCEFVVEGIYSDNRINHNYVLNGTNVIYCGARIKPAEVEIAVAGTNHTVEYGNVFDVSKVGVDYTVNGVRLESTSAEYKKIANIAKTIVTCEQNARTSVGSASIDLSYSDNQSFTFNTRPGTVRITKAKLYVESANVNVIKGNEVILPELTYSGWKNSDGLSVLKEVPKATTEANRHSDVGEYAIVISGGDATNYEFVYGTSAKVTVSQSQVEGSEWKDAVYEKGVYVKTAKYNYGMAVSMEVVTTNVDYKVEYFVYTNDSYGTDGEEPLSAAVEVGTYYVKAVVSYEGSTSQQLFGVLKIGKADINVEVYGYDSVTYDGQPHAVSGRVVGLSGLDVTVWYRDKTKANAHATKDAPTNAGTYTVWAEFDGEASNNYNSAKSAERTFTINTATVSVSVESDQFVYDGKAKAVQYSVANREKLADQGVYVAVRYKYGDNDYQIVYDSNYPDASQSGTAPSDVGTYEYGFILVGGKEGNYVIKRTTGSGLTGMLTIGQSQVTGGTINKITVAPSTSGETPTIIPVDTELVYTHYSSAEAAEESTWANALWKALTEGSQLTSDETLIFVARLMQLNGGIESNAFSGPVTITLQLPEGIAGSNVKLVRVNSSGEILEEVKCTFNGDSVVFETQDLGYYVFVKEAILNSTVIYILLGVLGFVAAAVVMVIALKKAAQYRNMKAIVAAKEDVDR